MKLFIVLAMVFLGGITLIDCYASYKKASLRNFVRWLLTHIIIAAKAGLYRRY